MTRSASHPAGPGAGFDVPPAAAEKPCGSLRVVVVALMAAALEAGDRAKSGGHGVLDGTGGYVGRAVDLLEQAELHLRAR